MKREKRMKAGTTQIRRMGARMPDHLADMAAVLHIRPMGFPVVDHHLLTPGPTMQKLEEDLVALVLMPSLRQMKL